MCSYPNTGASDIETRPKTKSVNISASKRFTSALAPLNSFHTKTPQIAEIMVLPSLSENEVAGPMVGVKAATKLQMVPAPQMSPPKTPQA
jgi:hypothetical protein